MTDETEDERPFSLNDGDCCIFDPEYMDPETESVGALAVQWSIEKGLWVLIGSHDDGGRYSQEWREVGASRTGAKLRPVN